MTRRSTSRDRAPRNNRRYAPLDRDQRKRSDDLKIYQCETPANPCLSEALFSSTGRAQRGRGASEASGAMQWRDGRAKRGATEGGVYADRRSMERSVTRARNAFAGGGNVCGATGPTNLLRLRPRKFSTADAFGRQILTEL